MVTTLEPYKAGWPNHWKYGKMRDVVGRMVAISGFRKTLRGLKLIYPRTRSLVKNEIVEISATNEKEVGVSKVVNNILYIGFFEVEVGSQVAVGEVVFIGGKNIGEVVGFGDIHCPNHINIITESGQWFLDQISKRPIRSWGSSSHIYDLDINTNETVIIRLLGRQ